MTEDHPIDDTAGEGECDPNTYRSIVQKHRPRHSILGPALADPPLLPGESRDDFKQLRAAIDAVLRPYDFLEEIHCENIALVILEERRLRRWRHSVLIEARRSAIEDALYEIEDDDPAGLGYEARELIPEAAKWAEGDEEITARVTALFAESRRSLETVLAAVVESSWSLVEKLDKQITILTLRRDNLLNQYDQRRESLSGGTRQTDQWRSSLVPNFP